MKTKLLLLITLLSYINTYAQVGFEDHIITDISEKTNQPKSIFTDIDSDGDMDVLLSSYGKISWYENLDGNGLFGRQQIISTEFGGSLSFDAIDIDNDGDIDIVTASFLDNEIAWYENLDGMGNFSDSQIIDIVDDPREISANDIDGDGDMDIIVAIGVPYERVSWYENLDGQGNFGDENVISLDLSNIHELLSADLDSDGDLDVFLVSANNDTIVWFENLDGQGNFGSIQIIAYASGPRYISAIDYDADGDLDILSYSMLQNRIGWYENNGQGSFGSMHVLFWNAENLGSLTTFDIDGDGDLDLFTEESNQGELISWYENLDGQGDLGPQQIINQETDSSPTTMNINFGDIDNDGDGDLLWTSYDAINWFRNLNGLGAFGERQTINTFLQNPISISTGDFDGDGDLDVLSSSYTNGKIVWFENIDGQGFFISKTPINTEIPYVTSVVSNDIDNDGDLDVLLASTNNIVWYKNLDGQGNFGDLQIITTEASSPKSIFSDDINGDGKIDVLLASTNNIAWYENLDGQGNFGTKQIISFNVNVPRSVYAADIDGDGDVDVLSASSSDDKVAWYENLDGLGNFGEQQIIYNYADGASSVYAADIDSDGDMDVVSVSSNDGKIAWYENLDGLGNFSTQIVINTNDNANYYTSVYVEDIDNDGDMDVISHSSMDSIAWYENLDGFGNFNSEQIISSEISELSSVYVSDVNGDGNIDILSASILNDKVVWHENLGFLNNHITGNVNFDINNNGCNGNNLGISNIMVTTDNGSNSFSTFTLNNGNYILNTNEGDFTTTITSELPNYFTSNPTFHTSNFIGLGNTDIADFCIEPIGDVNDLNISLYPLSDARPGFDATYQIVYRNVGTTILTDALELTFDETKISYLEASQAPVIQSSNSLTFDYYDLLPFETRTVDVLFNVFAPPTTDIGDILTFTGVISPVTGDYTEDDNTFILGQTVIGAYDPNDIRVLEGDEIFESETDNYLHYIIRFQNLGTAEAINVSVENVLDPNLDWNTLQIENISHTNRVEIKDGNQVEFVFDNINLPDSTTNEPESHGYIQYKIKPKSTVDIGDSMSNNADIYFDFNPPVATNTVITTVVENLSVGDNIKFKPVVYPNPTKDLLNINSNIPVVRMIIYNQLGQVILEKSNNEGVQFINVKKLSRGIYFIKLTDANFNNQIQKLIKE